MVLVVFTENLLIKRLFQSTFPTKSGGGLVKVKRLKLGEEEEKTQYWRGWQLASLRLRTEPSAAAVAIAPANGVPRMCLLVDY